MNTRNQLDELLRNLGCNETQESDYQFRSISPNGLFHCTLVVRFPDGREVRGEGEGSRKSIASIEAAQAVLDQINLQYPDLIVNWDEIFVEAQKGDALIKLGVYLSEDLITSSDRSYRLQKLESDSHLADIFDRLKNQGDPDLAKWGQNLGEKRKATLVEALLWERFGRKIIGEDATNELRYLINKIDLDL
jgi:hypothetical protein